MRSQHRLNVLRSREKRRNDRADILTFRIVEHRLSGADIIQRANEGSFRGQDFFTSRGTRNMLPSGVRPGGSFSFLVRFRPRLSSPSSNSGWMMSQILVVDDSPVDRRLVGGLLEKQPGWTISCAADGDEALALMASRIPDLVATDLVMPGRNGLELVAAVKADFPLVPVVLMTGKGSEDIALQALKAGAVGYVPKKQLARELPDAIRRILAASQEDRSLVRLMHRMTQNEASFELHNDPALVLSLVTYLQQMIRSLPLADETDRLRVRLAVEEALSNALYHGNLEFKSELDDLEVDARNAAVSARCSELPFRDRRIYVTSQIDRAQAVFTIRDEGPGFDPSALLGTAPSIDLDQSFGRGLLLMQAFMDEVRYNAAGNEVTLIKRASQEETLANGENS